MIIHKEEEEEEKKKLLSTDKAHECKRAVTCLIKSYLQATS
jgi:hypothetical protein